MKSEDGTKKMIIYKLILKIMKKLNKLHLNTGKLLRKEELIQLKGGYIVV
jgi:hypothetical protein